MKPGPVRMRGALTTWNDDRGFGFVSPVVGGADVFVHISVFEPGSPRPVAGDEVDYLLEFSPDGKPRASQAWVRLHGDTHARARRTAPPPRSSRLGYVAILGFGCIVFVVALIRPLPLWGAVLYVGASLVTFIAYAIDKRAAQTRAWRVQEGSLLALGLVGGWPGAIVAQQVLRHKTLKLSFQWMFWISVVLNVLGFVVLSWVSGLAPSS